MNCINKKCKHFGTGSCILGIAKEHGECSPIYPEIKKLSKEELEQEGEPLQYAYCENCNYETETMPFKDLVFKVCMEGGYIQYDGEGGTITECPKCHNNSLVIYS